LGCASPFAACFHHAHAAAQLPAFTGCGCSSTTGAGAVEALAGLAPRVSEAEGVG